MKVFFKGARIFQFSSELPSVHDLNELLAKRALQPCTALSTMSAGWLPVCDDRYAYAHGNHVFIRFGQFTKQVPGDVVRRATAEKMAGFERTRGFKAGKKATQQLKEQALTELLPRAFERQRAALIWIDCRAKRIVIDTGSAAAAESAVDYLRKTLGELAITLPQAETSPAQVMTAWLSAGHALPPFSLEEDCVLMSADAKKTTVRFLRHPLEREKLLRHIDSGLRATQLAVSWNGQLSAVLGDDLSIRRIKFLDIEEQPDDNLDAEFELFTGTVGEFIANLFTAFSVAESS